MQGLWNVDIGGGIRRYAISGVMSAGVHSRHDRRPNNSRGGLPI